MNKTLMLMAATVLTGGLLSQPVWPQVSQTGKNAPQAVRGEAQTMTIAGTIAEGGATGYVIQGVKPREVFTIHNPDPSILDKLARSSKTLTIQVRIILGDQVLIEKIDGKPYPGEKEAKPGKNNQP